jgi:parallel beta-helix repeat protein
VVLDGSGIGATADGFMVNAANSEVNGLSIVNFNRSAVLVQANGVKVRDNYLGLLQDGTNTGPNLNGIRVTSSGVQISNNLISGNVFGILLTSSSTNTIITNNVIGLSASGTLDKGNSTDGIRIEGGSGGNQMQNNVISGNGNDGIEIAGGGSANQIYGNKIGTLANGTSPLRNDNNGINLSGANDTVISSSNVIANNGRSGVYIGSGSGNLITNSSIYKNTQYGIEIVGAGTNDGILAPTMIRALWDPSYIFVEGTLSGLLPSSDYKLDLYTNQYGPQGENFVNSVTITTDGSGAANFGVAMPISVPDPISGTLTLVTGTVTDVNYNTSEFSNGVYAVGAAPTLTPSPTSSPTFTFTPTYTYTPTNTSSSPPTNTSAPAATSTSSGGPYYTSTPTISLTPTITDTPTMIPAYATLTQLVTEATGAATLTQAAYTETPTATRLISATPEPFTETPTEVVDMVATSLAATLTMQSILGFEDAGGGNAPVSTDGGGLFGLDSGPTMILVIFAGLALLLLIIGGGMELMRWLNSRD